jgi:hypothetical protein
MRRRHKYRHGRHRKVALSTVSQQGLSPFSCSLVFRWWRLAGRTLLSPLFSTPYSDGAAALPAVGGVDGGIDSVCGAGAPLCYIHLTFLKNPPKRHGHGACTASSIGSIEFLTSLILQECSVPLVFTHQQLQLKCHFNKLQTRTPLRKQHHHTA